MSTPKKRPAKRKAPHMATAAEEATGATTVPYCARLTKCAAGSCQYPQPCNHQTLQCNPSR